MSIDHHAWHSPHTGRSMRVVRYGTRGRPLIYVPTSSGDEYEFDRYGMPEVCAPWIDSGRVQIVAMDGSAPLTLWNEALDPAERMRAYAALERYASAELLPWLGSISEQRPGVAGASYGAFLAANLLFKYPRLVEFACGLGGVYGLWHRLDGHTSDDVYHHTPLDYMPDLTDASILSEIRATRGLVVFAAEEDPWLHSSIRMIDILRTKELPCIAEVWPAPATHHESWWRKQLRVFMEKHFR